MRLVSRDANDVYEIGNKIREAREAQGMSQDDLADVMETDRGTISRYERGLHEMSILTFIRFSEALNTKPEKLMPQRLSEKTDLSKREQLGESTASLSDSDLEILLGMAERMR